MAQKYWVAERLTLFVSDQRGSQSILEENLFYESPLSTYDGTLATTQKDNEPVQPSMKD